MTRWLAIAALALAFCSADADEEYHDTEVGDAAVTLNASTTAASTVYVNTHGYTVTDSTCYNPDDQNNLLSTRCRWNANFVHVSVRGFSMRADFDAPVDASSILHHNEAMYTHGLFLSDCIEECTGGEDVLGFEYRYVQEDGLRGSDGSGGNWKWWKHSVVLHLSSTFYASTKARAMIDNLDDATVASYKQSANVTWYGLTCPITSAVLDDASSTKYGASSTSVRPTRVDGDLHFSFNGYSFANTKNNWVRGAGWTAPDGKDFVFAADADQDYTIYENNTLGCSPMVTNNDTGHVGYGNYLCFQNTNKNRHAEDDDDGGMSTGTIIGIVVVVFVGAALFVTKALPMIQGGRVNQGEYATGPASARV